MARDAISQKRVGDLSLSYDFSSRANDYRKLAESLAAQAARKTAPACTRTRTRSCPPVNGTRARQQTSGSDGLTIRPVDDVVDAS